MGPVVVPLVRDDLCKLLRGREKYVLDGLQQKRSSYLPGGIRRLSACCQIISPYLYYLQKIPAQAIDNCLIRLTKLR